MHNIFLRLVLLLSLTLTVGTSWGQNINNCLPDPISGNRINKCYQLSSLEGASDLESEDYPATLTLYKSDASRLENPFGESNSEVNGVVLGGKQWLESDVELLIQAFPNVKVFGCEFCNIHNMTLVAKWPQLERVKLSMLTTIHNVTEYIRIYGIEPDDPLDLSALNYNQIDEIYVRPSVNTNFTCETLGLWARKLNFHSEVPGSYPLPYRDMDACLPSVDQVREFIRQGDSFYHEGNYQNAVDSYRKALEANPWDLKAISSYALGAYKVEDYCSGILVSEAGVRQSNGSGRTMASLYYNLYLNYLKAGRIADARVTLVKSNELVPIAFKSELLKELPLAGSINRLDCNSTNWLDSIKVNINQEALSRDRNLPREMGDFADYGLSEYELIKAVPGRRLTDVMYLEFEEVTLSTGYLGLLVTSAEPIRFLFGKGEIKCSVGGKRTYIGGLSGRLAYGKTEIYDYSDNYDFMAGDRYAYVLDIQEVTVLPDAETYYCHLAGDNIENWIFTSDQYQFELVQFLK